MPEPIHWKRQINQAISLRNPILEQEGTDCLRLFHGYSEGCPGVVIEKFGNIIVIDHKIDISSDLETIKESLIQHFAQDTVIIAKGHQSLQTKLKKRFKLLHGSMDQANQFCQEHGIKYSVSMDTAHNLGLYLDTRDARDWIRTHSQGRRILNLFAFTGSLGLNASLGQANEVVHLDKSSGLLARLKTNYELNNCPWDHRSFVKGDIYKHMPRAIRSQQYFDGIILDPPPKIYASRYAKQRPKGQDFNQLVRLCSQMLSDGAWLLCFFHRFDKDWDQCEQEVMDASSGLMTADRRLTSGDDFPESDLEKKLRVTAFRVSTARSEAH